MPTNSLRDAKAGFSRLIASAVEGEIVTITQSCKPVAVLVSVEAAEIARKALTRKLAGRVSYLRTFPGEAVRA